MLPIVELKGEIDAFEPILGRREGGNTGSEVKEVKESQERKAEGKAGRKAGGEACFPS